MREVVKIREVGGSLVVTLPQTVLEPTDLKVGDRVVVEASPPRRIILTKEGPIMSSAARMEIEISALEKERQAIASDLAYKIRQHESNMPTEEGMDDEHVAQLILSRLERDRDRMDAKIAGKRLELYDIQGGETAVAEPSTTPNDKTNAELVFRACVVLSGVDGSKEFTRKDVRSQLGVGSEEWQSRFTAVFQSMRDDHPGGAPAVSEPFNGVLHRLEQGRYRLTEKGRRNSVRFRSSMTR